MEELWIRPAMRMAENGDDHLIIAIAIADVGHAAVHRDQAAVADRKELRFLQQRILR